MSEIGFASIFPAGLFEAGPGPVYTEPNTLPNPQAQVVPPVWGTGKAGPEPPAVVNIAPGVLNQAVPQGDVPSDMAEPAGTVPTSIAAIDHGFGLILLLVLIVLGLWLLFRSGQ